MGIIQLVRLIDMKLTKYKNENNGTKSKYNYSLYRIPGFAQASSS
jgi:hypothetical protein